MEFNTIMVDTMSEVSDNDEPPLRFVSASDHVAEMKTNRKQKHDLFPAGKTSNEFRKRYYPKTTLSEWSDWEWQVANSITSFKQLKTFFPLIFSEQFQPNQELLPLRITPYYASLIDFANPHDPIGLSVIPSALELERNYGEKSDPLSEEKDMPVDGIVHRYPDRVLLLSTDSCAAYCRYCTRSHLVAKHKENNGMQTWIKSLNYIAEHPEVRDVLISGGDFLTYDDQQIEFLLSELRKIRHVEIIRIGTKVPVVLPQRITNSLLRILKKYHPLIMSIHFTHPRELTQEVKHACERLAMQEFLWEVRQCY